MDDRASTSGHLMLITPERVFYAGLLGRPRERCPGAFHVYVALRGGLWLTADGREVYGELVAVPPNVRHTITSDHRSVICITIEPESVRDGTFEEWEKRLQGAERDLFANRIRLAYETLLTQKCRCDVDAAEFDRMCFGEVLPQRRLDPRVVRSIARIRQILRRAGDGGKLRGGGGPFRLAFPAFVQAGNRHLLPFLPRLEARAASLAFRQPGPQPRAPGAGHRLSRFHAFQPFDPPLLWAEAARDLLGLARSRDLPQRTGGGRSGADLSRHCEERKRSEAIQTISAERFWIASLRLQ